MKRHGGALRKREGTAAGASLAIASGLALACVFVIAHFHRSNGAVLAPFLGTDPGLTPAEIGLVIGVMSFVSAACQPFTGVILDRYGPLRAAAVLATVATLGQAVFAWSAGPVGLAAGRALIGLGFATAVSGVYVFLVTRVRPENFSTWAAVILALGGTLGGFLGSAPLAVALADVGREAVFLGFAAVTAVLAVTAFCLARAGGRASHRPSEPVAETLRGLRRIMLDGRFIRLSIFGIASYGPFMAVGGLWAGPYLQGVHGLEGASLGSALFVLVLAFNAGTLLYGPLDRLFDTRRGVILVGAALQAISLVSLAVFPAMPLPAALAVLIAASLVAPTFVVMVGHGQALVEPRFAGRAITVMQIGLVGGTFALQYLTGLIVELFTMADGSIGPGAYRAVFAAVALILVVCAAVYSGVEDAKPSAGRTAAAGKP